MKPIIFAISLLIMASNVTYAADTRVYDKQGNLVGTQRPAQGGVVRDYDKQGNFVGESRRSGSQGDVRYYDKQGNFVGSTRR